MTDFTQTQLDNLPASCADAYLKPLDGERMPEAARVAAWCIKNANMPGIIPGRLYADFCSAINDFLSTIDGHPESAMRKVYDTLSYH